MIAVVGGDTTAHEVRKRARCQKCGVKGNNTYQIVYTGNSDVAMDGAGSGVMLAVRARKNTSTHASISSSMEPPLLLNGVNY